MPNHPFLGVHRVTSAMLYWIFYCNLDGVKVAAGEVHWKGKNEQVCIRTCTPAGRYGAFVANEDLS